MTVLKKTFGSDLYEVTWLVEKKHHGLRLDQFVQIYMPSFSREQIKKKIALNEIHLSGRPVNVRPKTRVHSGDNISLQIQNTTHEEEWWNGKKLDVNVAPETIYEDEGLIAISKPPYMSVHPTGKHLFNCVTVYFKNLRNQIVYSIHRLDRETSGILLLAKNAPTAATLTHCFETGQIKKCYFFISVVGKDYNGEREFHTHYRIASAERFGLRRVLMNLFPSDSSEGKEATTHFKILQQRNGYALGLAFPLTGRQHQIRVHAMGQGLPLLGDKLYCGSFEMFQRFKDGKATSEDHQIMEIPRHALHALAINFPYPKERKTLISPLSGDLQEWLKKHFSIDLADLERQFKREIANYFSTVDK